MNDIKSLADQLRTNINQQAKPPPVPEILERIRKYDNRDHRVLMHIRFDGATINRRRGNEAGRFFGSPPAGGTSRTQIHY